MHDAAGGSIPGVVTTLVEAGADPNERTGEGVTPLHVAAGISRAVPAVVTALDAGADPSARDENDETPWDYVRMDSRLRGTDVFWRLKDERHP